jgi:hypothetical protein
MDEARKAELECSNFSCQRLQKLAPRYTDRLQSSNDIRE